MNDTKKTFLSFKRDSKSRLIGVRTGPDKDETLLFSDDYKKDDAVFIKHSASNSLLEPQDGIDNVEYNDKLDIMQLCVRTIQRCEAVLSPYHDLIYLSDAMRTVMRAHGLENEIYNPTKLRGILIEESLDTETYSMEYRDFNVIRSGFESLRETDEGLAILPSSILLSVVASFDSIVGDFCKDFLGLYPEKLDQSDRQITYCELFTLDNLEDVRNNIIEEEVDRMLRGSHTEQARFLEKLIDTKIIENYQHWASFYELFERRNRYAHANGIANSMYLSRVKDSGLINKDVHIGSKLKLSSSYLHKSVDYLFEFGTILSFVAMRKLGSADEAFAVLSETSYDLIAKKRHLLASWLLDFALHKQPRNDVSDKVIRRSYINLANAYKKLEEHDKFEKVLKELDWSAVSLDFQICIASLKEDTEEFCRLMNLASASEYITKDNILEWPVFDWVRGKPEVAHKFKEVFGDDLPSDVLSARQETPDGEPGASQIEADTMH